tara:strand:- start:1842 stop:3878 length:2037 start_codon:yes stop_codon:yes gene_type:complete
MTVTGAAGTGDITFNAAVAGFQSVAAASVVNGDVIRYTIENGSSGFESGTGVIGLANNTYTMSRTPVTSSNSNNLITVSANAKVFLTALASDIVQFADDLLDIDTSTTTPSSGNALMWNYATSKWTPATPDSGAQVVATTTALLAISSPAAGAIVLVTESNKVYIYTGSSWFAMATLANQPPTAVTGVDSSYDLDDNTGTATTITAASSDPELFPLTWSYVTTGLGSIATISQADNVFTVTPSASTAGTFTLVIKATDSGGLTSQVSTSLNLIFGTWAVPTFKATLEPPSSYRTTSGTGFFGKFFVFSGDGTTLAVCYQNAANPALSISPHGEVHIYKLVTNTWTHQQTFQSPSPTANDAFGSLMQISNDGDTLAITSFAASSIYIYERSSNVFAHQTTITQTGAWNGDLSSDGNLLIAHRYNTSNSQLNTHSRSGSTWTWDTDRYLTPSSADGYSSSDKIMCAKISGDGTTLAIACGGGTGTIYVYKYNGSGWSSTISAGAEGILVNSSAGGISLATDVRINNDGNYIVWGDVNGQTGGAVYVYTRSGTTWSSAATIRPASYNSTNTAGGNAGFGRAVAINDAGNKMAVTAWKELDNFPSSYSSAGYGAVYFFTRSGTTWTEGGRVTRPAHPSGDWPGSNLGLVLSMDGAGFFAGAEMNYYGATPNWGAVHIYNEGS